MLSKLKFLTNTENKKRVFSNFISLFVLRGFQFLIPLITLPYLVRTIGITNYGLVNFALSLGMYFGAIIQFGFSVTATREIARNRDNPRKLSQIYSATMSASIILALLSAIFFVLLVMTVERFNSYLNLYLFTLAFVVFQSLFPIWFFQGMEKMKYITFLSLGTSLMFLISLFMFVKQENDFFFVPLLQASSAAVTLVLAIIVIKKQFKVSFKIPTFIEIKKTYQEGYHAFIAQLAPNFYNNSSVFLLGLFTNDTLVGLYTAATRVIDAVSSFGYILSNTFFPYLSRNLSQHKLFQIMMLGSGVMLALSTFSLSGWIAVTLFNHDNLEVALYIQWLSICVFLLFTILTYGPNYLMLVGKDYVVKNIALYTSVVFFVIALIIIPIFGIWGAVTVLVGGRLSMAVLQFIYYVKYHNLERI